TLARQHVRQERVGGNVEGHTKEQVGAALVELQIEPAGGNLGLEQAVAWRECHLRDLAWVPGGDDLPPRTRIGFDEFKEIADLVDVAAVRRLPVAPLLAVNRAEVAALVGP